MEFDDIHIDSITDVNIKKQCMECEVLYEFTVPAEAWNEWASGVNIQKSLYMLDAGQRELLISGICGNCFDKMFPEEEEDDE